MSDTPHLVYLVTHPMTARLLLRGQLEWFESRGYRTTLITSDDSEPASSLDSKPDSKVGRILRIPMAREISPLRDSATLLRLAALLRRLRPTVVNASTPKAGLLGAVAARMVGVPVRVYLQRGLRLETTSGLRRRLLTLTERLACRAATRVLCVSESLRRRSEELELCEPGSARVLGAGSSNGVEAERFTRLPNTQRAVRRRELGFEEETPVVGFVGRLTHDKGLDDLRQTFERFTRSAPDARLLLVGGFEPGDPVSELTRDWLDRDPRVVQVGSVPDTAEYYSLMDVLAFPSHREGFPNVPLEAAAAELPAVGYRVTGTRDAIADGVSGLLVERGDIAGLEQALLRYLTDSSLRRLHGSAARQRVERDFRPESVWRALEAEYIDLMSRSGSSAS